MLESTKIEQSPKISEISRKKTSASFPHLFYSYSLSWTNSGLFHLSSSLVQLSPTKEHGQCRQTLLNAKIESFKEAMMTNILLIHVVLHCLETHYSSVLLLHNCWGRQILESSWLVEITTLEYTLLLGWTQMEQKLLVYRCAIAVSVISFIFNRLRSL